MLLLSSSPAVLNRCGAFFIALRTFRTLGLAVVWSAERRPLPLDSAIVGSAELLFLLNDPKRSERDNERDSGLRRCKVELCEELGEEDDDSALRSSSVVTNLSSSARSASLFEVRFAVVEAAEPLPGPAVAIGSTSESWNNNGLNSYSSLIIVIK